MEIGPKNMKMIRELLNVLDIPKNMRGVLENAFKAQNFGAPLSKSRQDALVEAFDETVDDVIDALAPIYAKHFSENAIRGMIDFYRSDAGKEALNQQPAVIVDSMPIINEWAQKASDLAEEKLDDMDD